MPPSHPSQQEEVVPPLPELIADDDNDRPQKELVIQVGCEGVGLVEGGDNRRELTHSSVHASKVD